MDKQQRRALDLQVAEARGHTFPPDVENPNFGWEKQSDGSWQGEDYHFGTRSWIQLTWPPFYSTHWSAVREMEDWIAQQEGALWARYVQALCSVFLDDGSFEDLADVDEAWGWQFIRATPEQRCRAFLLAMERKG